MPDPLGYSPYGMFFEKRLTPAEWIGCCAFIGAMWLWAAGKSVRANGYKPRTFIFWGYLGFCLAGALLQLSVLASDSITSRGSGNWILTPTDTERFIKHYGELLQTWTDDEVLKWIVIGALVIVGLALLPGYIVALLLILVGMIAFAFAQMAYGALWSLASLSPAGSLIVNGIAGLAGVLVLRRLWRRLPNLHPVADSIVSLFVLRRRRPRLIRGNALPQSSSDPLHHLETELAALQRSNPMLPALPSVPFRSDGWFSAIGLWFGEAAKRVELRSQQRTNVEQLALFRQINELHTQFLTLLQTRRKIGSELQQSKVDAEFDELRIRKQRKELEFEIAKLDAQIQDLNAPKVPKSEDEHRFDRHRSRRFLDKLDELHERFKAPITEQLELVKLRRQLKIEIENEPLTGEERAELLRAVDEQFERLRKTKTTDVYERT